MFLANSSTVTNKLGCSFRYKTWNLIRYTLQTITRASRVSSQVTVHWTFSRIIHLNFCWTRFGTDLTYCWEKQSNLLVECKPLISEKCLALWTRKQMWHLKWDKDQQRSMPSFDVWFIYISKVPDQRIDKQSALYETYRLAKACHLHPSKMKPSRRASCAAWFFWVCPQNLDTKASLCSGLLVDSNWNE